MSRHVIILILILTTLFFVHTYNNDLDKLMRVPTSASSNESGIHDVTFETSRYDPLLEVVDGSYTILYFHSNSCPACRTLVKDLKRFLKVRPDVAVRKFDLGDNWTVDSAYNTYSLKIPMVPFIYIYDPDGSLISKDSENDREGYNLLYKWIRAELRNKSMK